MPGLKKSLVDPVPEVRGMSARALGAMVRGIGEQGFDNLLPWLMATLTSDGNTVNRYVYITAIISLCCVACFQIACILW